LRGIAPRPAAAVPLGRTLFAESNPIRTRGPMQVNVAFAE